jgi:hypothetical protein
MGRAADPAARDGLVSRGLGRDKFLCDCFDLHRLADMGGIEFLNHRPVLGSIR